MDPEPFSLIINILAIEASIVVGVTLLFFLLFCSALVSGAEVALFALTQSDLETALEENSKPIEIISKLLDRPKKLLATILVANNFINISIVILFAYLGGFFFQGISSTITRFIVEVVIVTFLILLFGEILPKIYANRNRVKFAKFMAYPLRFLDVVISPISLPMRSITIAMHNKLGKQKSNLNVNQLSQALELASEEDTTKEEQKILQGIVSFGNTDTKQVMQPRIDIFALDESLKFTELFSEIVKHGF